MSNYEGKLGEWLKYVQQQVESADKSVEENKPKETAEPEPRHEEPIEWPKPEDIVVRDRMGRAVPPDVAEISDSSVVADSSLIDDRRETLDRVPVLFDDTDIPDVEEYLPFLREPDFDSEPPKEVETKDQSLLFLPEGTGEPRPVVRRPSEDKFPEPPAQPIVPKVQPRERLREAVPPAGPDQGEVRRMWDKLPRHIQILVGQQPEEVAQKSYKEFTETREELIQRLLDPTLSLEEAARILNVCPTTVRRYTNRGALRHFRTAGNQRRFRLSDVLAFLESSTGVSGEQIEESVN